MHSSYNVNTSVKIRNLLFRDRLSQADLAREIGLSPSVLSSRIRGKSAFSAAEIKAIATFLRVSTDYLLSDEGVE